MDDNFNNIVFDTIIPMGDNCTAALILQDLKLRHRAFPWDWVESSPHQTLQDLQDNFSFLLGKEKQALNHYKDFSLEEINKILSLRIKRFNNFIDSNSNIILFNTCWVRIWTGCFIFLKYDCTNLHKLIDYFLPLQKDRNIYFLLVNLNNSFDSLRNRPNVILIDVTMENVNMEGVLYKEGTDHYLPHSERDDFRPSFLKQVQDGIKALNIKFNEFVDLRDNVEEPNKNLIDDWW